MLEDDELDFDDFGDLEGFEGQTLTTEELEKQLALEFDDITETKTEEVVSTELDEGEIVEDPTEKKTSESKGTTPAKPVTKPLDASAKPFQKHQQNYYNNNFYNQHPQQQQYTPDMMAMNMFPYPQYSNRIYVNPKFNNGAQVNQQQMLQQQQMAQQRQYMEMEAKRMALLHQQQLLMHKSRAAELDQKRRETAEMMKRRKELKESNGKNADNTQAGEKRKVEHISPEPERDTKRILRPSPAGGISIKGAAAAAAARGVYPSATPSSSPSRNLPYTPPHLKRPENNIRNRIGQTQTPPITSRLGRPEEKKPTVSAPISQVVPIVTGGKSNTLAINGFKDEIKEADIKNLTKDVPGGAQDIRINQDTKTATVVFPSIEAAVTFRRKFNRFQIGDTRINVVFQK